MDKTLMAVMGAVLGLTIVIAVVLEAGVVTEQIGGLSKEI